MSDVIELFPTPKELEDTPVFTSESDITQYINKITGEFTAGMLHVLTKEQFETGDEEMIDNMAFIAECFKAMAYHQLGIIHPLQDEMSDLIELMLIEEAKAEKNEE